MTARPRLTVDLDALASNYRTLQEMAPGADIAAVVKADAYGLGLEPVARTLWKAGARNFFTADVEEATLLRGHAPDARIYVLAGFAAGTETAFADPAVRPVLNTEAQVRAFAQAGGGAAILQVDTGMTRLGVPPAQLNALADALSRVDVDFLLSHLASADEPDAGFNRHQHGRFEEVRAHFPKVAHSLANSPGVFLDPDFHHHLCRPGIALYGGNPRPGRPNPMRPVVELDAQVLQIFELTEAARVGYGATFHAPAGARIATCAIGYADGLLRCTGNVGKALAAGVEVPFAGRVSMDLVGLDVSAVPTLREGDRVKLIWGPDGVDRLAAAAGTIAYEVLVRLGARVERRYVGGS